MADVDHVASLNDRLDALWVRYLNFLDEYTAAQAVIKKDMAAGFFSLTQANFTSSGRRYGQDHYDDRAVATLRAQIQEHGETLELNIVKAEPKGDEEETGPADVSEKHDAVPEEHDPKQLPSPSPTPEPELPGYHPGPHSEATSEKDTTSSTPKAHTHDPIRWFGILVPPALRQAQRSFTQAVQSETGIAQAVNAVRGLRDTDTEIRKLRKALRKAEKDASTAKTTDD